MLTPCNRADDKTAAEYGLEGGNTLHLVLALRGGRELLTSLQLHISDAHGQQKHHVYDTCIPAVRRGVLWQQKFRHHCRRTFRERQHAMDVLGFEHLLRLQMTVTRHETMTTERELGHERECEHELEQEDQSRDHESNAQLTAPIPKDKTSIQK